MAQFYYLYCHSLNVEEFYHSQHILIGMYLLIKEHLLPWPSPLPSLSYILYIYLVLCLAPFLWYQGLYYCIPGPGTGLNMY